MTALTYGGTLPSATSPVSSHHDVIVIGSGAGGGTLAHRLAPSGKRILLFERGEHVRREKENWSSRAVNLERRYQTKEVWKDRDGNDLHPHTSYAVGGNTKFFGATLFRLRREDFGELRHHGGLSPAWPIRYEDLEPYYAQAEALYQVHGARRRGLDGARGERAVPSPRGEPRAAAAAARRGSGGPGTPPVPHPARHHDRRAAPAREPLHPL